MLKTPLLAGAAALALLPLSATAQDHSEHDPHPGHVMPAADPNAADPVDHSAMDHGTMDHGAMDHGAMDHRSPTTPAEGSGTARAARRRQGLCPVDADAVGRKTDRMGPYPVKIDAEP